MEQNIVVSIICLSYNHEKFVERCLRSVVYQTYRNFEIIFIDNNSTDSSFDKGVEELKKSNVHYTAKKMESNTGISEGFNYAIKNIAKGKYIATLACDDWWDMYNLEEKVNYFESHPHFGMVYGNGYNYDERTSEISLYYKKPSISGSIFRKLLSAHEVNPQGILYRQDIISELGYFDPKAKVEDRDLWYRIALKYEIGYVHKPLTFYRVNHGANISRNLKYMKEGNEYFFTKYEKDYPEEIRRARKRQNQYFAYYRSTHEPSMKSLRAILADFQFNTPYIRSVIKCCLGILGLYKP
jgi:alpha-1,3-rhamnosyltransferase